MEQPIAEQEVQLAEDDEEGWRDYERQLRNLTDIRERVAAVCKEL